MGKAFDRIEPEQHAFIEQQHLFFVASAAHDGHVNVSPKDRASLRILDPHRIAYLDQTGSGNETAAHVRRTNRITLMFCAFAGPATIVRIYGRASVHLRPSPTYAALLAEHFANAEPPGARQILVVQITQVRTSCGYGVPLYAYRGERATLRKWAQAHDESALAAYRTQKNRLSIDGFPTGVDDG